MTVSKIEYYAWKFMSFIKDYISYTTVNISPGGEPPPTHIYAPVPRLITTVVDNFFYFLISFVQVSKMFGWLDQSFR